jgi:hypothetical protein
VQLDEQAQQYRQHLDRLMDRVQQSNENATISKTQSTNRAKKQKQAGWTCYHSDDPRALHSTARATEFCPDAGLKEKEKANCAEKAKEPLKMEVESLGEQWKAQFRAAASAQGVTEKRLRELDEVAKQPAAVQQLIDASPLKEQKRGGSGGAARARARVRARAGACAVPPPPSHPHPPPLPPPARKTDTSSTDSPPNVP